MDQLSNMFGGAMFPVALVLTVLFIVWGILLFLLPFFVYGASQRAKECSEKLDKLIALQEQALKRNTTASG
jgi:hypothetical protein